MGTTPQTLVTVGAPERVKVTSVPPTTLKPPEFIAAARSKKDRDYTPRYDIILAD